MKPQAMLRTQKAADLLAKKTNLGSLSEFEEALLLRELDSLERSDKLQANSLRAFSLALDGRFSESIALHKTVTQESRLPTFLGNFGSSLSMAGRHEESLALFIEACQIDPTGRDLLYLAIGEAMHVGDQAIIKSLREKYLTLTGEEHPSASYPDAIAASDVSKDFCFALSATSGAFDDWLRPEEDEAWKDLQ